MEYFLRFTETAKEDIKRATSFHYSDLLISETSKEDAADSFDCDIDDVVAYQGYWVQELDGLCGFDMTDRIQELLDNEYTIEEIVEELIEDGDINKSNVYNLRDMPAFAIYQGVLSSEFDLVPDGDLFHPTKLLFASK